MSGLGEQYSDITLIQISNTVDKRWYFGKEIRDWNIQGKAHPPINKSRQYDIIPEDTGLAVQKIFAIAEAMWTKLQVLHRQTI